MGLRGETLFQPRLSSRDTDNLKQSAAGVAVKGKITLYQTTVAGLKGISIETFQCSID